jgi:hypothetical protein
MIRFGSCRFWLLPSADICLLCSEVDRAMNGMNTEDKLSLGMWSNSEDKTDKSEL